MKKLTEVLVILTILFTGCFAVSIIPWNRSNLSLNEGDQILTNLGEASRVISETRANTYTTSSQSKPCVSWLTATTFVVAWQSAGQDTSDWGVYAKVFSSTGASLTGEFQVNSYITSLQTNPSVCRLTDTTFVVAWQSYGQDADGLGVYANVFSSTGANLTNEFRVNTYITNDQSSPSVDRLTDTTFVVAWQSTGQDADGLGVYANVFSSTGANLTNEFRVNTYITNEQSNPSVSRLTDTTFIVTWRSYLQDTDGYGGYANIFSNTGANLTNEFRVNTYITSDQSTQFVTQLNSTIFVIAWYSFGQDGNSHGVFAKVFSNTGANLTNDFLVNTYITGMQNNPSMCRLNDTTFVVAWQSNGQDSAGYGVYAKVFSSTGANLTSEFRVNTYITSDQMNPSVSRLTDTTFVVAWQSTGQDGDLDGCYFSSFTLQKVPSDQDIPSFEIVYSFAGLVLIMAVLLLAKRKNDIIIVK